MGFLSGLFGSSKTNVSNSPWETQAKYLKKGFERADQLYQDATQRGPWQGSLYPGMTELQRQGVSALAGAGQNLGLLNSYRDALSTATGLAPQVAQQYGQVFQQAALDPTAEIARRGAVFASNPFVRGMVQAAVRDDVRQVAESILPGLDATAAASGNMNSTRAGVVEGIVKRGLADRIADVSSQLRGQLYQQGLGLGAGTYGQQLQGMLSATSGLGGYSLGMAQQVPAAESALKEKAATLYTAGLAQQQDAIQQANEAKRQYEYPYLWNRGLLGDYWGIVGGANYGSRSTVPGPSPFAQVLGGTAAIGSILAGF